MIWNGIINHYYNFVMEEISFSIRIHLSQRKRRNHRVHGIEKNLVILLNKFFTNHSWTHHHHVSHSLIPLFLPVPHPSNDVSNDSLFPQFLSSFSHFFDTSFLPFFFHTFLSHIFSYRLLHVYKCIHPFLHP